IELGSATESQISDQIKYLITRLVEETDEIDIGDKKVVRKLVEKYLMKATNSNKASDWQEIL
ncbi:MAG: hypothetical protein ACRD5J_20180, partial [Nitrososphaeraceae archaeon]